MTAPLPACWRATDARAVFATEALEGSDAIFLATHTPIEGFDVAGSDAAEVRGNDERAILDTLSVSSRQHAFCVVQGEPGSGKSHLIRWLSINWPAGHDVKLLLRRADGSLDGALRQLRERLPAEFAPLFDNLGTRQRASSQGRANIFLSTLANTLEPGHFEVALDDEGWCGVYLPASLLSHPTIKANWKAPSRILNLIEGAQGGRKSASASFDLYDILDLVELGEPIKRTAPFQELMRRLEREAETIRVYRDQEWLADELAKEHANLFPTTLKFVEALNRRRNDAIQNVLGVSAQGLKTLFRQVREELAERGHRLVLLLEDITSWEGLDDSLIDVLVFNAAAKGDNEARPVCPLISVVGVTPHYYDRLQGNYRQRITHEVKLGHSSGGLQDVATLRHGETRLQFAARYLNAVRSGPAELDAWLDKRRAGEDEAIPNRCNTCPRQPACFDVFGEEGGTGLFPFTSHAFDRFYEALKDNDNGQTWKTPRGILQAILNPNLLQPDSLAAAAYPGPNIEPEAFRPERRSDNVLAPRLSQIVVNKIAAPEDQARMRRMLAYWANPDRANTTAESGEFTFAGTRRSIYEAFGLPWIGGTETIGEPEQTYSPGITPAPVFEEEPEPTGSTKRPPSADPAPETSPKTKSAPKPKRLMPTKTELERLREEIRAWSADRAIENASKWNGLLYLIVQQIDARRLGVPRTLFDRLLTAEMVKLQGTTTRTLGYLTIPDAPWVRNGLEAFVALKQDVDMDVGDAEFNRRYLATMMRHLEKYVGGYLSQRIPALPDRRRWSPVVTFAQILLVRSYLRGETTPEAPTINQVRIVLSDEGVSETDFTARSAPWQEWLNATKSTHERIRDELRSMVSLGLSEGPGGAALTDASELVGAIVRLQDSGKLDPVPEDNGPLTDPYKRAREVALLWSEKRLQIERIEFEQVKTRSTALSRLLRGNDVATHLQRLDNCVTDISTQLPSAASDKVAMWKQAYERIKPQLAANAGKKVEDLILAIEGEEVPVKHLLRLRWLATAPARDLEDLLSVAQIGERSVEALRDHARDCVQETSGTGSLADIKAIGRAITAAVSRSAHIKASQ
jgi:hypothetical protein